MPLSSSSAGCSAGASATGSGFASSARRRPAAFGARRPPARRRPRRGGGLRRGGRGLLGLAGALARLRGRLLGRGSLGGVGGRSVGGRRLGGGRDVGGGGGVGHGGLRGGRLGGLGLGGLGALGLRGRGLHGLRDLGLGDIARLALAGLGQRGLGGGALAGLGLGAVLLLLLAAGPLLLLAAGLLLGLLARLLLLGAEDLAALGDDVADRLGDQRAGADRVVVARDDVVDAVRVAVGVDEADDRDPQALGLADGDDLRLEVDHEHRVRRALHVLDAAEVGLELLEVGLGRHPLARRQQLQLALGRVALEVVQALDALRDGLEVRQQAAEPAVVDVRLTGRLGDLLHGVARLLLGAHEQHGAAAVGDVAGEALRLIEQRLGLEQVDDVDAAVLAMDEAAHLGVPAASLVAEVHAGLQQLADSYLSHGGAPLGLVLVVQPGRSRSGDPARARRAGPVTRVA